MGKVGKFIIGGLLIVGGIAVGVFTGNWQVGIAMASAGVGIITRPTIPQDLGKQQGAILQTRIGTQNGVPVIYGTTQIAGIYVDVRVDSTSTGRKRLVIVVAWCMGSRDGGDIQAIDEVWFDDRLAISAGVVQAPFSQIAEGTTKHLEFAHHLGSATQTVDSRLASLFPGQWPSSSAGRGICYSRFELWYNTDVYGSGVPTTIQAKIRGARVEDPRTRLYAFSNNPALCIRDYLLSPIYGQNVAVGNLDAQAFVDMANHCDEVVNVPGVGNVARYVLDGYVDTGRSVSENLARLCTSCRGMIVSEGEKWRLFIRRARVPSGFVIDETNTVEGTWKYTLAGSDVPNVVRVTYVDPLQKYQTDQVQWPSPSQINFYLQADNNYESRLEMDLPYTQNRARAQQLAMVMLKESRQATVVTVSLQEAALSLRVGDLVYVTQPSPGWVNKVFDVFALLLQSDGGIQAVLIEYDPSSYNLDTQPTPDVIPNTNLPNPFTCAAPTSLSLDGSAAVAIVGGDGNLYTGRIQVGWSVPVDPFIAYVEIQARLRAQLLGADAMPQQLGQYEYLGFTEAAQHDIASLGLAVGDQLSMLAEVWNVVAGNNERVRVRFWDVSHALISTSDGNLVNSTSPTISKFDGVAIPANTVYISARMLSGGGTDGRIRNAVLSKTLQSYDSWGRHAAESTPQFYIQPAPSGWWDVQIRAQNRIGVSSGWLLGTVLVVDWPPQVTTLTLTSAHVDSAHSDVAHVDAAHGDTPHSDSHSDVAHSDVAHVDSAHGDSHTDSHTDVIHGDSHSDRSLGGIDYDDNHWDQAHQDSHSDVAHQDSAHQDSAHTDSHTDTHSDTAHSDGPHGDSHTDIGHGDGNYGVGVAVQADANAGSIKVCARKGGVNKITNGGGETGTVGAQATGWTNGAGNGLLVATDFYYLGSRSMKIDNPVAADSQNYQDIAVTAGKVYRLHAWIKTSALPTADAGLGAFINVDIQAGGGTFTIVSKVTVGADPNAAQPDCGIAADGATHAFAYVECVFTCSSATTLRVYCQLGYTGTQSGTAWFDDVWLQEVYATTALPDLDDVRSQPANDGRNVVGIALIDIATGNMLAFAPGEVANIAGVAYSKVQGQGIEGPVGRAQTSNFPIAPVGTDKWVPA